MISIIPQPVHVESQDDSFNLNALTIVVADNELLREAHRLVDLIDSRTDHKPLINPRARRKNNLIELILDTSLEELSHEGYLLTSTSEAVTLRSSHQAGLFYGIQTFLQLLPMEEIGSHTNSESTIQIPCVKIRDFPRFGWRGAMLDVSRHFMPPEFLKKFIELLAMHKMNIFHLHLTDDQGWRIEIKKFPKLTEVGAWREESLIGHRFEEPARFDGKAHGGFYSQETIRELVEFAGKHHVTIIPEIDMPGHTQAAIGAYPNLGNVPDGIPVSTTWGVHKNILNPDEETIRFMQDVLDEVMQLFPSEFVHIGGDEVETEQWVQSQSVQARMQGLNLKDESELYGYFVGRMAEFLHDRGHRLIGWDEIMEANPPRDSIVMAWRGLEYGIKAAKAGHDVIMAPMEWTYLDWYQSDDTDSEPLAIGGYLPLEKAYSFEPIPDVLSTDERKFILGGQAQLWTEYMLDDRHVEYMAFPRLTALAEALWTPKSERSFDDFKRRLHKHLIRLRGLDVNFHNPS
jgi:hexosaminidase